jgi:hypothetical protein
MFDINKASRVHLLMQLCSFIEKNLAIATIEAHI